MKSLAQVSDASLNSGTPVNSAAQSVNDSRNYPNVQASDSIGMIKDEEDPPIQPMEEMES